MGKAARERNRAERKAFESAAAAEEWADEVARQVRYLLLSGAGPEGRLQGAVYLRQVADQVQDESVRELLAMGVPRARVGRVLGVTGQAVGKRYGSGPAESGQAGHRVE